MLASLYLVFFFEGYADHRDLHVPTHSFPTRRSSDLASPAMAHEVWVERDAAGPARIYLGEPADPVPAAGAPEFSTLTAPRLIGAEAAKPVALVRRATHRSAERRVGQECVSTCCYRRSPYP